MPATLRELATKSFSLWTGKHALDMIRSAAQTTHSTMHAMHAHMDCVRHCPGQFINTHRPPHLHSFMYKVYLEHLGVQCNSGACRGPSWNKKYCCSAAAKADSCCSECGSPGGACTGCSSSWHVLENGKCGKEDGASCSLSDGDCHSGAKNCLGYNCCSKAGTRVVQMPCQHLLMPPRPSSGTF